MSLANNTDKALNVYILTASIKTEGREFKALPATFAQKLQNTLMKRNKDSTVTLIDVSGMFYDCLPTANMNTRFTPMCMLRLFADKAEEIPDKILYLDCDILCNDSFEEFYSQDVSQTEIVGVPDRYGKWFFSKPLWKHNYLNSGVLLMNMENIRKSGVFSRCRALCREKRMFMPDQTALNKLAVKEKAPSRYNNQGRIKQDTVFKHFTTFFKFLPYFRAVTVKPWQKDKLHSELGIYQFDILLNDFEKEKQSYEKRDTDFLYNR